LASAWSKSGKPRRTLHRVVGVLAKIQIERFASTSEATPFETAGSVTDVNNDVY